MGNSFLISMFKKIKLYLFYYLLLIISDHSQADVHRTSHENDKKFPTLSNAIYAILSIRFETSIYKYHKQIKKSTSQAFTSGPLNYHSPLNDRKFLLLREGASNGPLGKASFQIH